jgi:hypothetical protein
MCCCCVVQVRLVLEYCDKGCLKTALDDGVFILGEYLISPHYVNTQHLFIYLLSLYFFIFVFFNSASIYFFPPSDP